MYIKRFLTFLLVVVISVSNMSMVQADEINDNKNTYLYENLVGVYRDTNTTDKIVETVEDLNYTLDNLKLTTEGTFLSVQTSIDGENIQFNTMLYPSQLGNDTQNKMIGVVQNDGNQQYKILKLTIEKNANESTLLAPNMYLSGKTVISFAVYNIKSLEEYYVQFSIDNYDFDTVYNNAKLNLENIDKDEVLDTEIAYYVLEPKEQFIESFNSIEEIKFHNSAIASEQQSEKNMDMVQDIEGKTINQLIEISKTKPIDLSRNTYGLIPNIPDSLYKKQTNGTWTNGDTGYDSNGNLVGYTIYHMNDPYSGNVLNYVLRYFCTSRFKWIVDEFGTSFNLSHNIWVQYIKSSNSVSVFDDRASNARIVISPEIHLKVDTSKDRDGYFISRKTNACKNGSIAKNIAQVIIGYVPYLSDINNIYQTLTSTTSTGNNSQIWFEANYTKEVKAKIKNLKYAPNEKGYSQDYIGMTVYGNEVDSISYGYSWTAYTK